MLRVTAIVATCLLLVGFAARATYDRTAPDARAAGIALYPYRQSLLKVLDLGMSKPGSVVWLGDSTLMGIPAVPSYSHLAQRRVLGDLRLPYLLLTTPGLDAFAFWALAGRVAEMRPKAVVLVANLRIMKPAGYTTRYLDLVGELDWADLPGALALPYSVRGLTAPRIVLARSLTTPLGEDLFLVAEGLRRTMHDAEAWRWLGPDDPPELDRVRQALRNALALTDEYDRPLGPRQPMVRYLGAAVERLARSGAAVLVVVTPIPMDRLTKAGRYDRARFEARVDALRAAVQAAGGELLDLHSAFPGDHFRDISSHFSMIGAQRMADVVGSRVRGMLVARHPGLVPPIPRPGPAVPPAGAPPVP